MSHSPTVAEAVALYDAFAAAYDRSFDTEPMRRVYERLAWEGVAALLPARIGTVVDVGCGTGRNAERLRTLGHAVIGIEPSPEMRAVLAGKPALAHGFTLLPDTMEEAVLPEAASDAVLAMGSLQYAVDPRAAMARLVHWVRPGGLVCVLVDSRIALTFELLRLGRTEEALTRLDEGCGVFSYGGRRSGVHLFDAGGIAALMREAGLGAVETRGILVSASAQGREACSAAIQADEEALLALERRLREVPALADAGKHILAWGYREA
ncbi:class I SAM-dependent methyltransferase [Methylobacterium nonmethylotrophicum]|uniref:Methyltransferase domain-containing protein n=1 Tax=Methylobacterium nonmethylotrophicum TaxID=1141884 RepID=A0A4Z0NIR3_9HYPH|nr:class I SAM-dependent methyltransferase [Methylobacterium nonmethylotrophicum]TGD95494.1 methyltransferase domain-containing protein [Methylobacterium nonmethylotrophicum]